MDIKFNFDIKTIIIIILILLITFGGFYHFRKIGEKNDKITQEQNLTKALNDTIHTYVRKNGEVVSEKRTIQAELSELKDKNLVLTTNQERVLKLVEDINKKNQVIAAAVVEMGVKIKDLTIDKPTTETDSTITFNAPPSSDSLKFTALVGNVTKYKGREPYFKLQNFELPNIQKIDFHWKDNKKEGYPVSFSISNSNKYYKTYNIDSYIIPEIEEQKLKPTFWRKLGTFSSKTGGKIVLGVAGFAIGFIVAK